MSSPTNPNRRRFLRGALTAGAGMAAVAIAPQGVTAVIPDTPEPREAPGKQGYRLTQHILDYYRSAAR